MENILLKYMNERYSGEEKEYREPGPVITISRQYGCYASEIAEELTKLINERTKGKKWQYLTREILEKAAEDLNVKPEKISHIFGASEKSFLKDMMDSFSDNKIVTDANIKKTITDIVKSYAVGGNCVIVGRAGCMIARDIPRSLHVRIIAPLEWRSEGVAKRFSITKDKAQKQVLDCDKIRDNFMNFFRGNKPDADLFDVILNRKKSNIKEIVETIYKMAEMRKIV